MDFNDFGQLAYLGLLGAVLVFWFVVQARQGLGKIMQQALTWGLLFVGVIAAVGLWDDVRHTVQPRQSVFSEENRIELPRAADGHYYINLKVNEQPIDFVVDTGASGVVLTALDARKIGLDPATLIYTGRAFTANGEVRTAPVKLDEIRIGDIIDRNVRAWVNEGDMDQSLLGMSYLQGYSSIEIRDGSLILTR